ncbi:restriction endonuclease [Campylobacter sp. JMF_08 NE1]|uniref:restriction endonuclease n=1 Tax=Campylobacter sp. JMF_08 NE1 TaxID=2983821 RepID=UPI0022E9E1AB|nr:restriction endonuclease [Campylobacter sp. JMF_08 NE1]MDA3047953.1 restriction endonuclease [Campylobacter sp. JMF_08 NE1]
MAIPTFKEMMFPILKFMSDKQIHTRQDTMKFIVDYFKLNNEEKSIMVSSQQMFLYENRASWALSYLTGKINLIQRVSLGKYKITELGQKIAKSEKEFEELCNKTYTGKQNPNFKKTAENPQNNTPDENLNLNLDEINDNVKSEIMDRILHNEPRFFENLALRLLEKIGYGVSMGELTQNGADGGIDGIVNEDILGFSKIYIQAKRFDKGVVGRPEIQKFVGVLATKPTKKGLFITTSKFSNEAVEFASNLQGYSVVLIDGDRLLDLMLKYKLGVQVKEIKEIFAVDNDFFDDENY